MNENFAIIGGDKRIVELSKFLAKDENRVYIYGIHDESLKNIEGIVLCDNIKLAVDNSQFIIGPIPFSVDDVYVNTPLSVEKIRIVDVFDNIKKQILIAGALKKNVIELAEDKKIKIFDIMKREELAVLNVIATVEGTIKIIIENRNKILQGSKVLVLGFGRIGKILAQKLTALSAKVICAARKIEDFAWIKAYGYESTNINEIGENLSEFDIIINTAPSMILTDKNIQFIRQDCLLIDLASNPGGIDKNAVNERNIKLIHALGIPGKIAPVTSAEFLRDTIYNII